MNFNEKAHIWERISLSQKQAANDLIDMLDISYNNNVLDIGCGTGYLTDIIYKRTKNTAGIDISEKMIEVAKSIRPHIKFDVGNAEELNSHERFDWIITNAVTYYFKDIPRTFKLFYNALKYGGHYALQSQTERTPEFIYLFKMLENDPITKTIFSTFKLPTTILDSTQLIDTLVYQGFTIKKTKVINYKTEYTLDEALDVFKSGAATQYLNCNAYQMKLSDIYIDRFWAIIKDGLKEQSQKDKIILGFPRCFIVAQKC